MRLLSNPAVQSVLLIFILTFYAVTLTRDVIALRRDRRAEGGRTTDNGHLVYAQQSGIDIYGKRVVLVASSSNHSDRYVAFLLRSNSIARDLDFWNSVAQQLQAHRQIHLVGYCDGDQCAAQVRELRPPAFPILLDSDPIDIQAVLNADAEGKAIIKSPPPVNSPFVVWRGIKNTAEQTVTELTK